MYRYLGMIWNRQAPFRERVATQLSLRLRERCTEYGVALDRPGLRVFTTYRQGALDAHLLESNRGVVIGSIFERREDLFDESPTPIAAFDAHRTNRIVESQGRALVSGYWGNYVAFLIGGPTSAIRILKDPTGPLPCHIASFCGISIIFSCLQDCLDIGIRPFSVNWDYVAAKVASNGVDASQNPLNNVSSLCPGQCIEFDAENVAIHSRRLYWKPVSFSEPSSALDDTDLAAKALRATVRSVTHTLIRGHGSILSRLSGGLDLPSSPVVSEASVPRRKSERTSHSPPAENPTSVDGHGCPPATLGSSSSNGPSILIGSRSSLPFGCRHR